MKEDFDPVAKVEDALDKLPGGCGEALGQLLFAPIYILVLIATCIGMFFVWMGLVAAFVLTVLATPFVIFFDIGSPKNDDLMSKK